MYVCSRVHALAVLMHDDYDGKDDDYVGGRYRDGSAETGDVAPRDAGSGCRGEKQRQTCRCRQERR